MEPVEREKRWSLHFPGWVRDWAMRLLPWALMGIISASVGLYIDNIANKRDIDRNTWRNNQQDTRLDRMDARLDRLEAHVTNKQQEDEEFQNEVLDRLRKLLAGKR